MRRKNWINKKKLFIDNIYTHDFLFKQNNKFIDKHRSAEYLMKIFYFKNRVVYLQPRLNLFFLKFIFNFFKFFKKTNMLRNFYKIYRNDNIILSPSYMFPSQYFEYRPLFFTFLKKNNLKGFFFYKNLFKQSRYFNDYSFNKRLYIGYNFYLINSTYKVFEKINNILMDKEFNKIGKAKYFVNFNENFNLNYFLNYNIYMLSIIEIYKINIYLFYKNL